MKEEISFNEQNLTNRKEGIDNVIDYLGRTGTFDVCTDDQKKREIFDTLTREKALSFLERVNGILIGMPIADREAIKHKSWVSKGGTEEFAYIPPDNQGVQEKIIDDLIIPTLKNLNLDDASMYAATCINLLHMFPEGNGRLGRLINFMFCEDNSTLFSQEGLENLRRVLLSRNGTLNCDPSLIEPEVKGFIEEKVRGEKLKDVPIDIIPSKPKDIAIESIDEIRGFFDSRAQIDKGDLHLAVINYLSTHDSAVDVFKKDGRIEVDVDTFLESLTTEEQLRDFYTAYQSIKVIRFTIFSRMFTTPNKFPTEEGINLKELFEYRIVGCQVQHYKHLHDAFELER